MGGETTAKSSRSVEIVADAAYQILSSDPKKCTGNFFIDEVVLRDSGVKDFEKYRLSSQDLLRDFFISDEIANNLPTKTMNFYK